MRLSSTTNTALIVALTPIMGMLVAAVARAERVRPLGVLGLLFGLAGVAAVVLGQPNASVTGGTLGDMLVLSSVMSFTLGSALVSKLARHLDTMLICLATHALGALMLLAHTLASDAQGSLAGHAELGLVDLAGADLLGRGRDRFGNSGMDPVNFFHRRGPDHLCPLLGTNFRHCLRRGDRRAHDGLAPHRPGGRHGRYLVHVAQRPAALGVAPPGTANCRGGCLRDV